MSSEHILVLGVGNLLLHDEGVGVRVVERLEADYTFSPNVELMDGGTLGLRLLDPITRADHLIVVDAVQNGGTPGDLYHFPVEELNKRLTFKNSLHQLDLVESLAMADMMGHRPRSAVVIGVEPADISPWGTTLTETVARRLPDLCLTVLDAIRCVGGSHTVKSETEREQGSPLLSAL